MWLVLSVPHFRRPHETRLLQLHHQRLIDLYPVRVPTHHQLPIPRPPHRHQPQPAVRRRASGRASSVGGGGAKDGLGRFGAGFHGVANVGFVGGQGEEGTEDGPDVGDGEVASTGGVGGGGGGGGGWRGDGGFLGGGEGETVRGLGVDGLNDLEEGVDLRQVGRGREDESTNAHVVTESE